MRCLRCRPPTNLPRARSRSSSAASRTSSIPIVKLRSTIFATSMRATSARERGGQPHGRPARVRPRNVAPDRAPSADAARDPAVVAILDASALRHQLRSQIERAALVVPCFGIAPQCCRSSTSQANGCRSTPKRRSAVDEDSRLLLHDGSRARPTSSPSGSAPATGCPPAWAASPISTAKPTVLWLYQNDIGEVIYHAIAPRATARGSAAP